MGEEIRKTGIDIVGDVRWGTHFCQFYQTKVDLVDTMVSCFKAGLIHNIGKVRVPAEIFTNPDGLSETEFTMIKMHTLLDYEILKTMDLPWTIAQSVHQHHERMDGYGYPSGISGEDIILEARVLAVADVV